MRPVAFVAIIISSVVMSIVPVGSTLAAPCWRQPAAGEIIDPFRAPPCPWCAGNRGIEYRTAVGSPVRAVAAGRVTFSGSVAGTRYVVVEVAVGWRLTYGRLVSTTLRRGDPVTTGSVVGRSSGELFFGLRVRGTYRDPAPFLGRWAGRPRLVPLDGSAPRYVAPRWRCGV